MFFPVPTFILYDFCVSFWEKTFFYMKESQLYNGEVKNTSLGCQYRGSEKILDEI